MNNGKPKKKMSMEVEESSGNIFADLNLPNPEELLARSKVISQIHRIIVEGHLTDATAARKMGIPVTDVGTILRGDVEDRYSKRDLRRLLSNLQKIVNGSKNGKHKTNKASSTKG